MKYLSLFSGIGCFDYVLNKYGHECVGYAEVDKYASAIYRYQFGSNVRSLGDVSRIKEDVLPNFDILAAGFPCQAFSIAGSRKGLQDTRGTLFYEVARIARSKKPKYILLENVKGLCSHSNGETFLTVIETLTEIGYDCQWEVVNSRRVFRNAQNRERIFIVGHLRGQSRPEVFPIGLQAGCGEAEDNRSVGKDVSYCLDANYYKGIGPSGKQNGKRQVIIDKGLFRRLTPVECERLTGLPDNWTAKGDFNGEVKDISDTQRYKCCGNAVVTNCVDYIVERLS